MNQVMQDVSKRANETSHKIAIIVFGSITKHGHIDFETAQSCSLAQKTYVFHARPIIRRTGGGDIVKQSENGCAVGIVVFSREAKKDDRTHIVDKVERHLIDCYALPAHCITKLYGRDFKDITNALIARKFSGNIIVPGKKHLFLGLDRFARVCKESNLNSPRYIER